MSEKEENKLNKILYYSDIHPADTDFINNIIFNLCQERNIANIILTELEEYLKQEIENIKNNYSQVNGNYFNMNYVIETYEKVLDKIQELKEKYNLLGDEENE